MPQACFQGKYRKTIDENKKDGNSEEDIDIYELMVIGLRLGLRMNDFDNMDYPMLANLIDASIPKKAEEEEKPKYRIATQKDIDMIV